MNVSAAIPNAVIGSIATRISAGERNDSALRVDRRLAAAPGLELGARDLVAGVVARADERARLDVLEAECLCGGLHLGELVRVVVALDREVLERQPQVLADREDVAVDLAHRVEGRGRAVTGRPLPDHP